MKKRIYSMYKKVTNEQNETRYVTVVGVLTQQKETVPVTTEAEVERLDGKIVNGILTYPIKRTKRELTMAYSICHPTDAFNEEQGKKIALRRITTDPIGSVSSYNITMLNDDAINLLLFGECNYIASHIDSYIETNNEEEEADCFCLENETFDECFDRIMNQTDETIEDVEDTAIGI